VLDFAKIERGVGDVELAEADLGDVVERAAELCGHRAERVDLDLEVDIEPELPAVRIDANAMTLATLNLLDNAIKYAADGKRLLVGVRREGERMVLEVRDFGPGIAHEEQHAIFERFYRAKAVRLKPIRGSGIGLALVKHIAEAHGGGLEVESEEGQGATFRLWIPMGAGG
jgi:two-component system phosphate regulon sensor histidine kinase PhoR